MLNKEKHRTMLVNILRDIYTSDIGKYLGFKGGTASYFFYGLDRFSADLDFDLLDETKNVDDDLKKILKKYGKLKNGQQIVLSYGEKDVNINIDINRKVLKNYNYIFLNLYGITVKVQDKATIFTNKLFALSQRNVNRDIYDVHFFLKNAFPIDEKAVREKTGKSVKELLTSIKEKLEKIPKDYQILQGLGELLDNKQKSLVKPHLLTETIGMLELKIDFMNK